MPDQSSFTLSNKMNPLASLQGELKKTLLHKIEEGEDELSQLAYKHCTFLVMGGLMNSPLGLFAPTPVNTPHITNFSRNEDMVICSNGSATETPSGVQEKFDFPQIAVCGLKEEIYEPIESLINSSLLLDLPESKAYDYSACSPVLKNQVESDCQEKEKDGDTCVWHSCDSIQEGEDGGRKVRGLVGELRKGFTKISLKGKRMIEFVGKHTRFTYSSDNEIEEEKKGDEEERGNDDHEFDEYHNCYNDHGNGDYYDANHNNDDDDEDDVEEDGVFICKLYKGLCKKCLKEKRRPEFLGKHTRLIYNSDDEFEGVC